MKNETGFCSPRRRADILTIVAGVVWLCSGAGEAYGQIASSACRAAGFVMYDANGNTVRSRDAANPALIPCQGDHFESGGLFVHYPKSGPQAYVFSVISWDVVANAFPQRCPYLGTLFGCEPGIRPNGYVSTKYALVTAANVPILEMSELEAQAEWTPSECNGSPAQYSGSSSVRRLVVNGQVVRPGTESQTYDLGGFGIGNFLTVRTNVRIVLDDAIIVRALQIESNGEPFLVFGEAIAGAGDPPCSD